MAAKPFPEYVPKKPTVVVPNQRERMVVEIEDKAIDEDAVTSLFVKGGPLAHLDLTPGKVDLRPGRGVCGLVPANEGLIFLTLEDQRIEVPVFQQVGSQKLLFPHHPYAESRERSQCHGVFGRMWAWLDSPPIEGDVRDQFISDLLENDRVTEPPCRLDPLEVLKRLLGGEGWLKGRKKTIPPLRILFRVSKKGRVEEILDRKKSTDDVRTRPCL
jgi:hypothetical protein